MKYYCTALMNLKINGVTSMNLKNIVITTPNKLTIADIEEAKHKTASEYNITDKDIIILNFFEVDG